MQFFPANFKAFGEQVLGIGKSEVTNKAKSLLSGKGVSAKFQAFAEQAFGNAKNKVPTQLSTLPSEKEKLHNAFSSAVDFQAFAEQEGIGKGKDTISNKANSLLPRNATPNNAFGTGNDIANRDKTSLQNLLQNKNTDKEINKDFDIPSLGKLSRDDLLTLRDALTEKGVSGDRLNRLNDLIESGRKIDPTDVLKALQGIELDDFDTSISFDLTDSEKLDFNSFLGKLGFTDSEIKGVLNDLQNGGDINAWNLIESKIASLPSDKVFDVSKEEISALSRAFRLSEGQRTQLEGIFTPSLSVNSSRLAEALSPINTEMALRNQSDILVHGTDVVKETIVEVLGLAKERKEIEDKSDNRQSQLSQRMDTRIQDKVTSQGDTLPQAAPNPTSDAKDTQATIAKDTQAPIAKDTQATMHGDKASDNPDEHFSEKEANKDKAGQQSDDNRSRHTETGTSKSTTTTTTDGFISKVINADPSLLNTTQSQPTEGSRSQTATFTSQVFHQVESGILKSLQDGVKQLTLQLTPDDLGTLTLIVSAREKEVSALIRADNPETARLIEEQLHKIRNALESQGLKIENLEVQSNVNDKEHSQEWQGANKHNFSQQELEYRERARLLHKLRQTDNPVAHDVQNIGIDRLNAEKNSQSEIYIVT